jgi:hypothetical protein
MARLSGKWTLKAIGSEAGWQQRIVISGSRASDGAFVMAVGTIVPHVEGEAINVRSQALNPTTNTWIDSLVDESMSWNDATGLQVTLRFDDNPPAGDLDFNDLIVLCVAEDAALSSPLVGPRPDLTIPERFLGRPMPTNDKHR